ncbi:MAG: membrane dipeptidase [Candidatus Lokiarchaeota archaeon]|nr:membrane dipeptidase [Candidatus Lokiarchaeota archaeon]
MNNNFNNSVIDGHVDTVYQLPKDKRDFSIRSEIGHYDRYRMEVGNVQAALFAIYPASTQNRILKKLDLWFKFVSNPKNNLEQIKRFDDFDKVKSSGKRGAILHFEGAGGIDNNLRLLRISYHLGLRSLGLIWSGINNFASAAMFTGSQNKSGLTEKGRELVAEAQSLGITVDVSHLNDPSFWDVIEVTEKPLFATHSNARVIVDHPRNLTDDQIKVIHENRGTIGINFAMIFLNAIKPNMYDYNLGFDSIKNHIDHIVDVASINTVAIGSDFDGADMPTCVKDCSTYPQLWEYLLKNGYSKQDIEKISHANLLRVFKETWK